MLWLMRMAAFFTLAAAAGLVTAKVRNFPLFPDRAMLSCEEDAKKNFALELAEFQAHYQMGNLVIDARPASEFEKGHLACPMIMCVPADAWSDHMDRLMNFVTQPIVIYCTSLECHLAEELFCNLKKMGFVSMKIYRPGWQDGILKEHLPTAIGPEPGMGEVDADAAAATEAAAPDPSTTEAESQPTSAPADSSRKEPSDG